MTEHAGKAQYFAFISHKSSDSRFSLRLQKFIESYNLPVEVRRQTKSPKRLTPLCSYEVDFSSNPLLEEMDNKLRQSQFLILLCSEELIRSGAKYINYEIETFIRIKTEEGIDPLKRIIPIILNGSFGDPEHECCPDALKALGDNCPIAIDVRKYKSEREVFLHAISGMLDIDYAVLQNRDLKRRRRKLISTAAACFLSLLLAWGLLDYFVPKTYHYQDFVLQNGLPVGIGELSKSEYQRMNAHYEITVQQRKIVELKHVNSYGTVVDHGNDWYYGDRPARYVFGYVRSELSTVTYYDRSGVPIYVLQYSGHSAADLKDPYQPSYPYYLGEGFESFTPNLLSSDTLNLNGGISRFMYEYDENGYVVKETFHADSSGRPVTDAGVYGFEYELDEKGRIVKKYFLDANGEHRLNSEGIYCKAYEFDSENRLVSCKNFARDGSLVQNADGVAHLVRTYDENHNIATVELFDENGSPVYVSAYTSAKQVQTFDERGNRILVLFYDANGEPAVTLGVSGMRFAYDENGFEISRTYLNAEGKPTMRQDVGYASVQFINDENGRVLEECFCDVNGAPINDSNGYARTVYTYNERGQTTRTQYYDVNGEAADFCGLGYSVETTEYDAYGRVSAYAYWNADGEPVTIKAGSVSSIGHGFHRREFSVSLSGSTRTVKTAYYDKDGALTERITSTGERTYAQSETVYQGAEITFSAMYDTSGAYYGSRIETTVEHTPKGERITTTNRYNASGVMTYQQRLSYDTHGILTKKEETLFESPNVVSMIRTTVYRSSGETESASSVSYNKLGQMESVKTVQYDEDELEVTTEFRIFSYNEAGMQDGEATTLTNAQGVKISKYIVAYTAPGVKDFEQTTQYDEDGDPKTEYTVLYDAEEKTTYDIVYNKDGSYTNTVRIYDLNGKIKATYVFKCDKDGNIIG